jgi:serine/threonine protein kinase
MLDMLGGPMDEKQTALEAGAVVGPFRLRRRLGEGAAGIVWLAERERDGLLVALKLLRPGVAGDETARRRFAREARAAAEVQHPHLVPVLDAGEDGGRAWLATRYVDGRSLADRLAGGPLTLPELLSVVAEVAAGLQALHERGLVHRDVKPSNIMLDVGGHAALADFGLAKGAVYSALTRPGQVLGTLAYMAPELIRGEPASPASDLYALGCVAFEGLAGAPPFAGRGVLALGLAHLQDDPPDPLAERPEVPAGVGWTVLSALAKEPGRRPTTTVAFANLLATAARGTPGAAPG